MNTTKLFNRNFSLMIIGQIISLFGNSMLRFSLSLYILKTTGSASIFGTILAISIIPTILLSPIGGLIADRVSRKHIMIVLDFFTSLLIFSFSIINGQSASVYLIGGMMILLSIIQACYQPAVQASIPLLASKENLMQANGIVVQVNALANLIGPILSGILFTLLAFHHLLLISAIAFFLSAILECIMKIPFTKRVSEKQGISMVIHDLKSGMQFILKKQPILWKLLLVLACLNLVLSSLITVGLPVISNVILGLSPVYYGWLEASIGIGTILGSLCIPFFYKRYTIQKSHLFLLIGSICLSPLVIALYFQQNVYVSYALVLIGSVATMLFATIFNIYAQTFLQQTTPNELLGKVSSFVTMMTMCSYPIGQAIYGFLFEPFAQEAYLIVLTAIIISITISIMTKKYVEQIES